MLGIGMQEILIILVVALIVIGPKRLPDLAKTLGRGFAEFKKAADDLQNTVRQDLERERHEEVKKKYPDLVPDEEESPSPSAGPEASTPKTAGPETSDKPDQKSETLSYRPEEIEGGTPTKDPTDA